MPRWKLPASVIVQLDMVHVVTFHFLPPLWPKTDSLSAPYFHVDYSNISVIVTSCTGTTIAVITGVGSVSVVVIRPINWRTPAAEEEDATRKSFSHDRE